MPEDYGELEDLERFWRRKAVEIYTVYPGTIVQYVPEMRRASVRPDFKIVEIDHDGNEQVVDHPIIHHVPVVFPSTDAFAITFPLGVGDTVELRSSMRSLDRWLEQGGPLDPIDDRMFDVNDAIATPGLASWNKVRSGSDGPMRLEHFDTGAMIELYPDGKIVLTSDDVRLGDVGATDYVALASLVAAELTRLWAAMAAHSHTDPLTGVTGIWVPTDMNPSVDAGDVAADKVTAT